MTITPLKISTFGAIAVLAALLMAANTSHAHGGGTNADGCHNNRSTGDYHCHGAKPAPAQAPRSSLYGPAPARASGGTAYANCSEARAAGAAPVRRGQPGYGSHLDRDNDGVGCE